MTDEEGTVKSVIDLSSLHTSPAPGSILISTASWNREVEDLLEDRKISRSVELKAIPWVQCQWNPS